MNSRYEQQLYPQMVCPQHLYCSCINLSSFVVCDVVWASVVYLLLYIRPGITICVILSARSWLRCFRMYIAGSCFKCATLTMYLRVSGVLFVILSWRLVEPHELLLLCSSSVSVFYCDCVFCIFKTYALPRNSTDRALCFYYITRLILSTDVDSKVAAPKQLLVHVFNVTPSLSNTVRTPTC